MNTKLLINAWIDFHISKACCIDEEIDWGIFRINPSLDAEQVKDFTEWLDNLRKAKEQLGKCLGYYQYKNIEEIFNALNN